MVELTQGRTRQIREMFQSIGHPVQKLRRVAIGSLRDPHLPLGSLRELSEKEIQRLLKSARAPQEKKTGKGAAAKPPAPRPVRKAAKRSAAKKPVPRAGRSAARPRSGRR
jgi:hypothetical protein